MATETREKEQPVEGDAAILKELRDNFDLALEFEKDNRELAKADLKILAGETWSKDDAAQRAADGRPCLRFPMLPQYVDQVVGDWRQNRVDIQARPGTGQESVREYVSEDGKPVAAHEAYAGLIRAITKDGKADQARDTALEQCVSCGFGHYRVITEYSKDGFDQVIGFERIRDQFAVLWDPSATDYSRRDAMWCLVAADIPRVKFEQDYPDAIQSSNDLEEGHGDWMKPDTVRLVEYFKRVPVKRTLYLLSDGRIVRGDEQFEAVKDELAASGVTVTKERQVEDHELNWYLCTGAEILDRRDGQGDESMPGRLIPIVSVWGKEEYAGEGQVRYRSLIRYAHDAQRMFDYMRSAGIERIALEPKAPLIIGKSQIGDYEGLYKTANTVNHAFLPYDDTENKAPPQRNMPPQAGSAYIQEAELARNDVRAAIGMYQASLGERSNETSGKAIMARQRESDVMSFPYLDNAARSIEYEYEVIADLIPAIYDTRRIARILNADDSEVRVIFNDEILDEQTGNLVKMNDLSIASFDVSCSVGPSYTTQRQQATESMIEFVQAVPAAGALTGDLIAKAQDWPGADEFAKRLKFMLPPEVRQEEDSEQEVPPHVQQMVEQSQQIIQQLEAQLQELAPQLQQSQTAIEQAKAETVAAKMQQQLNKQAADIAAKQMKVDYDERVLTLSHEVDKIKDSLNAKQGDQSSQLLQAHQEGMAKTDQAMVAFQQTSHMLAESMAQNATVMAQAVAAIGQAAERMATAAEQTAKYMGADRTIVKDQRGEPVGVRIVQ